MCASQGYIYQLQGHTGNMPMIPGIVDYMKVKCQGHLDTMIREGCPVRLLKYVKVTQDICQGHTGNMSRSPRILGYVKVTYQGHPDNRICQGHPE